ncbi:MAG: DUF4230 domain-containing protein [Symploca sp. SIO1B1]|nr:DUF4230 domain-containing protein [Symploca sp. SIO1C2]NER93191.1 DUF4230 domain-containing protein [Symploca sp. SIO1B1]
MREQLQKSRFSRIIYKLPKNIMLMTTASVALLVMTSGIGMMFTGARFVDKVKGLFSISETAPEVDVRSLIVSQISGASELTTAVFTMEAVVPTRQDRLIAGYPVGSTQLLYIAYGEVRAGVDLGELKVEDVNIVNDTIELQLPPPKLLDSKIDVSRSQVYDYDRGFLGLGPDVAPQLQMLAQQETLKKIEATACREDLLQQANERAQLVVSQLLTTSGHKGIEVKTQPPATGVCS